jgi:hypothetical protein
MKRLLFATLVIALLLPACGPVPTPVPTPDIPATTQAMTNEIVASTLTAMPTATATAIPTQTSLPPTATATFTPEPTGTSTPTETATSIPFQGTLAPAGLDGTLPVKKFLVENNSSKTVKLFITGVSSPGDKPLYYEYEITGSFAFDIVWGSFQYLVYVGNRQFSGSFRINNYDKTVMHVYTNKVVVTGP